MLNFIEQKRSLRRAALSIVGLLTAFLFYCSISVGGVAADQVIFQALNQNQTNQLDEKTFNHLTKLGETLNVQPILSVPPADALTRYINNPLIPMGGDGSIDVEKTGPRVVLKENATSYKMWYEAVPSPNASTVGYATSTDGRVWTKQGSVLSPSATWEGGSNGEISPNTVLFENGVYKMWYHSFGPDGRRRIGYATSANGINWVKNPNPVLNVGAAGSYDDFMVVEPRVFRLDNGSYRMYYGAMRQTEQGIGVYRLMTATSNNGITWTKQNQVIFGPVDSGFGIVKDGQLWHMWYGLSSNGLAYASSTNGLVWTDGPNNPVLELNPDQAAPDSEAVGDSISAYKDGNEFRVMYTGGRYNSFGRNESICLATINEVASPAPRTTSFDFDGDGRADVSIFRRSNSMWYLLGSQEGFSAGQFGLSTDKLAPADYDGDGKTDMAVYRGGTWYLQRSSLGFTTIDFGTSDDIPVPADYDGDGKAELAVYRPSNGFWYSLNLTNLEIKAVQFGIAGDQPVVADYDGDGKADYAVYRPSTGTWLLFSSNQGFTTRQFGTNTDRPVPADYDGDGKADPAVFRPATGVWYLLLSNQGFSAVQFGTATDVPTPADYDGDGITDVAVFRPSTGVWYLRESTQGLTALQFGIDSDNPIPATFLPN